ncbi:MAG: S8 family serine peptidase [Caldisericales bacterium]|nr:S8 family serine peptidase [Caldisericales bacterium]
MRRYLVWAVIFVLSAGLFPIGRVLSAYDIYLITVEGGSAYKMEALGFPPAHSGLTSKILLASAKEAIKKNCRSAIFRFDFDYLFTGMSLELDEQDACIAKNMPFVKSVMKIGKLEPAAVRSVAEVVGASQLYEIKDQKGNFVNGKDILVGVIDSGIDYRHQDLGNGMYGPGAKVIGGTNFVEPKDPPLDDEAMGHGTSVAGIIASDNTKAPGIASGAKMMSYRVFSNKNPEVREDVVVAAIQAAAKDGCKIINISLSKPGGSSSELSASAYAAEQATKAGISVVGSAGDFGSFCDGVEGGTVGGPSVSPNSICVGSSDTRPVCKVKIEGSSRNVFGMMSVPLISFSNPQSIELVDGGYGSEEEFSKTNVLGKYVLIKRGPEVGEAIPFFQKLLNAKKRGAVGAIVWNHSLGEVFQMFVGFNSITGEPIRNEELVPSCFIGNSDGLFLQKLVSGQEARVSIAEENIDTIARMTAIGPTSDLIFKPDVCAPGIGVPAPVSTNSADGNTSKYTQNFSGTSASAGIVSGAVALIKQINPDWSPSDIRLALMNTSKLLINPATGEYSSMLLQGAGQINAKMAAFTPCVVSPGGLIVTKDKSKDIKLTFSGLGSDASFKVRFEVLNKLDDYVKFTGQDTVVVSGKSEATYTFTIDYSATDIPWNAECIIWFESDKAKLHVPVICWKGYSTSEKRNITSLRVTGNNIDYGGKGDKVTIEFGMAMGDRFTYKPLSYKTKTDEEAPQPRETMISGVQFDLIDGNGDTWVTIKRFENTQYGYYKFDWSGEDAEGAYSIPDGSYGLKIVISETVLEPGSAKLKTKNSSQLARDTIRIKGSKVQSPPKFFMVAQPHTPSANQKVLVDCYVTFAKDISSLSFNVSYNPDEVEILQVWPGRFLQSDGSPVESDVYLDKLNGKIKVISKRANQTGIDGHGIILRFLATFPNPSAPTIKFDDLNPYDPRGRFIPHMGFPLELEVTDAEPLLGDLNFDGIVDIEDYFIFAQSYGSRRDELHYNPLADFNSDGIIDFEDLKVLLNNLGKSE